MAKKRRLKVSLVIESDGKHHAQLLRPMWFRERIAGPGSIWKMTHCQVTVLGEPKPEPEPKPAPSR